MSQSLATKALLAAVLIAAALLRCAALDRQSLWDDEVSTLHEVGLVYAPAATEPTYPPLYFLLLRGWLRLTVPSYVSARAFSALWGILGVAFVYAAGARMVSRAGGLLAAALLAFSPFHLAYSQEARAYTMLFALSLASMWSLWERRWTTYLPVTVALLYTHYWGLFVWAAGAVWVLSLRHDRAALLSTGLAGATFLPWVPNLIRHSHQVAGVFWTPPPAAARIAETLLAFAGTSFHVGGQLFENRNILAPAAGALLLLAAVRKEDSRATLRLLLCSAILGLGLPFLISFWKPQVFVSFRYTMAIFPAAVLLAARGWESLPAQARTATVAALLATSAFGILHYFTWDKGNMKAVAAEVDRLPVRDAVVIVPAYMQPLFNLYYRGPLPEVNETGVDTLAPILASHRQAVLVTLDVPNPVKEALGARYRRIAEAHFPGDFHLGIVLTVYQLR